MVKCTDWCLRSREVSFAGDIQTPHADVSSTSMEKFPRLGAAGALRALQGACSCSYVIQTDRNYL